MTRAADKTPLSRSGTEGSLPVVTKAGAPGPVDDDDDDTTDEDPDSDRLLMMTEAGAILPLVSLLTTGGMTAKENAAAALWHLAQRVIERLLVLGLGSTAV